MLLFAVVIREIAITAQVTITQEEDLYSMLDYMGIERGRTRVEWVSAAEGVKFSTVMNKFVEDIRALGECVKLGDIRCKD